MSSSSVSKDISHCVKQTNEKIDQTEQSLWLQELLEITTPGFSGIAVRSVLDIVFILAIVVYSLLIIFQNQSIHIVKSYASPFLSTKIIANLFTFDQ